MPMRIALAMLPADFKELREFTAQAASIAEELENRNAEGANTDIIEQATGELVKALGSIALMYSQEKELRRALVEKLRDSVQDQLDSARTVLCLCDIEEYGG